MNESNENCQLVLVKRVSYSFGGNKNGVQIFCGKLVFK